MDFKTARNCNCEQEVEKKIHVNERTGKMHKRTRALWETAEQADRTTELEKRRGKKVFLI